MGESTSNNGAVTGDLAHGPGTELWQVVGGQSPAPGLEGSAGNRFVLGEEIAHGGMGAIYTARDVALDRDVAVKVLRGKYQDHPQAARRFIQEARIAGQLQHPGVAPVHALGTLPDGRLFLAMKLIKGRSLAELLRDEARPNLPSLLLIFEQIGQTVAYAHSKGVIHRDLKPANIMVGKFGEVQVMDWGLAKLLESGERDAPEQSEGATLDPPSSVIENPRESDSYTQAGSILGTLAYMPPEQARGDLARVDRRADVFALGALLCEFLTGKPPYTGSGSQIREWAEAGKLDDAIARLDGCGADAELIALAKHCLAVDPASRPADASEVALAAARHRAGVEERLRQAEIARAADRVKAIEQRKRRRVQQGLAFAMLLVVGLVAGVFAWQNREAANRKLAVEREERQRQSEKDEAARRRQHERELQDLKLRQAVELALDQADNALRHDKLDLAAASLHQATKQLEDAGPADLRERLQHCRQDLDVARQLDKLRYRRWSAVSERNSQTPAAVQFLPIFLSSRVWQEHKTPDELAKAVKSSPIERQLLAGLYSWLVVEPSEITRSLIAGTLNSIDPDPGRAELRIALALRNGKVLSEKVVTLKGRDMPALLVVGLAEFDAIERSQRLRLLMEAWAEHPSDFALALVLGILSMETKTASDRAEAIHWFHVALALRPDSGITYLHMGSALRDTGADEAVLAAYAKATQLDPDNAWTHANYGVMLRHVRHDLAGALVEQREAVRLEPTSAWLQNDLGNTLQANGDLDGALAAHREAVRLAPALPRARMDLGGILEANADLAGAIASYREGVRLAPQESGYQIKLANALTANEHYAEALTLFKKANADKINDPLRYRMICCAVRAGTGQGADAPPASDRSALRREALDALRSDLEEMKKNLAGDPVAARSMVHRRAKRWLNDASLMAVRQPASIRRLPMSERDGWKTLWADVRAVRDQTMP